MKHNAKLYNPKQDYARVNIFDYYIPKLGD